MPVIILTLLPFIASFGFQFFIRSSLQVCRHSQVVSPAVGYTPGYWLGCWLPLVAGLPGLVDCCYVTGYWLRYVILLLVGVIQYITSLSILPPSPSDFDIDAICHWRCLVYWLAVAITPLVIAATLLRHILVNATIVSLSVIGLHHLVWHG